MHDPCITPSVPYCLPSRAKQSADRLVAVRAVHEEVRLVVESIQMIGRMKC